MSTNRRRPPLTYEVLFGTRFIPTRPELVRKHQVFRCRTPDGEVYRAVAAALPEFEGLDDGIYIADANGDQAGVPITIYGDPVEFTVTPGPPEG